jgi:hypothetical protein
MFEIGRKNIGGHKAGEDHARSQCPLCGGTNDRAKDRAKKCALIEAGFSR